jgi:hypothetical protein
MQRLCVDDFVLSCPCKLALLWLCVSSVSASGGYMAMQVLANRQEKAGEQVYSPASPDCFY